MSIENEVKKTSKMLEENKFNVAEIIFEGGISIKDVSALEIVQQWIDQGKAFGVAHVIYFTKEGQQRVIDITTGDGAAAVPKK